MKITSSIPLSWYIYASVPQANRKESPPSLKKKVETHRIVEPLEAYNKSGRKEYKLFERNNITHEKENNSHHGDVYLCNRINKHV